MNRATFTLSFVILANVFVPVLYFYGFWAIWVPQAWSILNMLHQLARGDCTLGWLTSIYLSLYAGSSLVAAITTWGLISLIRFPFLRTTVQCLVLASLFSCSFAPVITYGGWGGSGGTYTFWTAVNRFLEKRTLW